MFVLLMGTVMTAFAPPAAAASWSDYGVGANGMISVQPDMRTVYVVSPTCAPRLVFSLNNGTTAMVNLNTSIEWYSHLGVSACISAPTLSPGLLTSVSSANWWTSAGDIPAEIVWPLTITNVHVTPGNKVMNVTWDPPAVSKWIDHYDFYYWQSSVGGLYGKVGIKAFDSYQIRVPQNADDWNIQIIPVNIFGQGARTEINGAANITPKSPARVSLYPGDSQLRVVFAPTLPDDSSITSYDLRINPGNIHVVLEPGNRDVTLTEGISNNVTYQASVSAFNAVGMSNPTDSNLVTTRAMPTAVRNVQASAHGARGVNITWDATSQSVTKYVVSTTTGLRTEVPASQTNAQFSDLLSNATPGNNIGFSVIAVNDYLSSNATTTTSALKPSAPESVNLSSGFKSVTADWATPRNLDTPALSYDVELVGPNNTVVASATAAGTETQLTFADLTSGQRLRARVSVKTVWGTSTFSQLSPTAAVEDVPSAPQALIVTQAKSQSAAALVTMGNVDSRGCAVESWSVIATWTDAEGNSQQVSATTSARSANQTISGFSFGDTVTFTASARNCWGQGESTSQVLTMVQPPLPVTNAQATVDSQGQVIITWTPSETSSVSSVIVTLSPSGKTVTVNNNTRRVIFAGTTLGQTYSATLISKNGSGSSPAVSTNSVFTAVLPSAVGNLTATVNTGSSSATITWQEPNYTGYPIDGYLVTVDDREPQTISETTITLTGLQPGENHIISVQAINALGNGPAASTTFGLAATPVATPDSTGTVIVWDLSSTVTSSSLLAVQQRTTASSSWKTIATVKAGAKKIVVKKSAKNSQFRVITTAKGKTFVVKSRKVK
jgi:titin